MEEPPLLGGNRRSGNAFKTGSSCVREEGNEFDRSQAQVQVSAAAPSLLKVLDDGHGRTAGNCYMTAPSTCLLATLVPKLFPSSKPVEEVIASLEIYMTFEAMQLRDDEILEGTIPRGVSTRIL